MIQVLIRSLLRISSFTSRRIGGLGVNVTVLKGVTIGDNTLVGAGSLVTRSLPPGVIAAGVPARVLRKIDGSEVQ